MNSKENYLDLVLALPPFEPGGNEIPIAVEQIAAALCCTPRNARLVLRRLAEEQYLEWRSGLGRGNYSAIRPLRPVEEVAVELLRELLGKGRMEEAIALIQRKAFPVQVQNRLRGLLEEQFGFRVEKSTAERLDILRIPRGRELSSMDPIIASSAAEVFLLGQIGNRLVSYNPRKRSFEPELARAWERSADGSKWSVYLRKGVRFHHGRTLVSRDVQYTLERMMTEQSLCRWQVEDIERVELPDELTVVFHLRRPYSFFLSFLANVTMSILPYDVPFDEKKIIGTGPFYIHERTTEVLILAAFETYFRERAFLDRVELWRFPGLEASERHYQLVHPQQTSELMVLDGKRLKSFTPGCRYLIFNFRKPGVQHHPDFRQAMRILFDPVPLLRELKGNRISPAASFFPAISRKFVYPEGSLTEAADLLARSGYAGEPLKLFHFEKSESAEDAIWLQERARQIGLVLRRESFPIVDSSMGSIEEEADMLFMEEVLEDDVKWGMLRLFRDGTSFVYRMLNPQQLAIIEKELKRYAQLDDEGEQRQIIDRLEQLLRDNLWMLYGYHADRLTRVHPAFRGLTLNSFGWVDFSKLWIRPDN